MHKFIFHMLCIGKTMCQEFHAVVMYVAEQVTPLHPGNATGKSSAASRPAPPGVAEVVPALSAETC